MCRRPPVFFRLFLSVHGCVLLQPQLGAGHGVCVSRRGQSNHYY